MTKLTTSAKLASLSGFVFSARRLRRQKMMDGGAAASAAAATGCHAGAAATAPAGRRRGRPHRYSSPSFPAACRIFRSMSATACSSNMTNPISTDRARATLQKQAAWLQRFGAVVLTIEGHCDERGTREYNLGLGARRAQAVKDYLASLGVSAARLDTISYGKERPVCVESNDACWAQNRRGVSVIKSGAVS